MEKNIGFNDRLVRLILGLCAIAGAYFIAINVNWLAGIIVALLGAFSIYEALVGWCIVYKILGKNTCPIEGRYKNSLQ
jgi:putative Mn2+ efflux pump MntP